MYKIILRTLSALSITTISLTFGAGFAQAQEDRIKTCTGLESYECTANEQLCAANPFSSMVENGENCHDVLGVNYRTALVRFCGKPANKDDPECTSVLNKPTAANWSHNALEGTVDVLNTTNPKNQFLRGRESGLLTNRTVLRGYTRIDFGESIRDRSIHGMAYFHTIKNDEKHFYAGILSGTDLGGLVTEVAGLAVWSGKFGATGDNHVLSDVPFDFDLTVDFGNKKLTAFIRKSPGTTATIGGDLYFSIDGSIESGAANTGLITGKVDFGRFLMNDKTQPTGEIESATLSGLIGTDGVVGVFVSDDDGDGSPTHTTYGHFAGGFIAKPPSDAEKVILLNNCGTDPFNSVCFSDATHNKNREAKCLIDPSLPGCIITVKRVCEVEENPFSLLCKEKYEPVRLARVELCNVDTEDPLCGDKFADKICAYDPFSAICFNGGGGATPEDRAERIRLCEGANPTVSCNTAKKHPNVANWINSFAEAGTALSSDRDGENPKNEFLKDTLKGLKPQGTKLFNRFNYAAVVSDLDMSTATFGGTALGGDVKNGVSFFRGWDSTHGKYLHYAAVWTGTDLGAPLMGNTGKAGWVGHFETAGFYAVSQTDFILEVNFDSGSIKAFVPYSGDQFFHLDGTFNDSGLIKGTSELAYFRNQNRELKDESKASNTGLLRGLIGANGALGVFLSDEIGALNGKHAYSGGFVARVNDNINHILTVLDACDTNPFGLLCNLDYETERADTINLCIEGDTMLASPDICRHAVARHPCIENPFAEECVTDFAQYYEAAQAKRFAFCANVTGSSIHPHCVVALQPNAETWVKSFKTEDNPQGLSDVPDTGGDIRDQFLKGTADGVNVGTSQGQLYYRSLNLADATFDDAAVDGNGRATNGVAFFKKHVNGLEDSHYAGIFSGTDLGAPLVAPTEQENPKMTWYGRIRSMGTVNWNHGFSLEINFGVGSRTGTVKLEKVAEVAEVYRSLPDQLDGYIQGEFDANGVIYGKNRTGNSLNGNLVLTGLIGQDGAVGAFYRRDFSTSRTLDDGTPVTIKAYSGGFVASPNAAFNSNVRYSSWIRSPGVFSSGYRNRTAFVRGRKVSLNRGRSRENNHNYRYTEGDSLFFARVNNSGGGVNGVGYMAEYNNNFNWSFQRSGILSGTDLGAPLDRTVATSWRGKIGLVISSTFYANNVTIPQRDITLNINFDSREVTIRNDNLHHINLTANWTNGGAYDGVLTGTMDYKGHKGIVTGLIGQDGAVGAFRSDHEGQNIHAETTPPGYAGGFIALPNAITFDSNVNFSDWVRSFGDAAPKHVVTVEAGVAVGHTRSQFLQGNETGLDVGALYNIRKIGKVTLADVNDGDGADGVSYVLGYGTVLANGAGWIQYYAGILSDTNLGAPLVVKPAIQGQNQTAIWKGKLGMISYGNTVPLRDIDLIVDFTSKNIKIENSTINGAHFVKLNASWVTGGNNDGVLTGTITHNFGATSVSATNIIGTVTGLIGQEGTVGAFTSNNIGSGTRGYSGGFVARP